MNDNGEMTCPLCTEEMDLTDQQLKPCNCGYEICVWCWHHIMEMAEKDGDEGRCPACRTAYDKGKIEGMAANCERVVAGLTSERRQKSQKTKPKASEGKIHLSNVRVIQRNLVYIIGLPLNLANEDLLQQKEYFGQYGKVLKVSISRTASGAIQHSANNSCCVYITYSKEDDAIRCIQSVHSFILDGRPLRACFGTTKYCHAWLRNMPCTIPDCLYMHDFGSQEDSFTKDEIVSAFTRSKVQQTIGATNNMHRRSGNVLPSPADECINSNITSAAKPIANNSSNNIENQSKGSGADIVTGKPNKLPMAASWVMRVSATLPPNKNLPGLVRPPSNQPLTCKVPQVLESEVGSTTKSIQSAKQMEAEAISKVHHNSMSEPFELVKEDFDVCQIALSYTNEEATLVSIPATITSKHHLPCQPSSRDGDRDIATPPSRTSSLEHTQPFSSTGSAEDDTSHFVMDFPGLSSEISSISLQRHLEIENAVPVVSDSSILNHALLNLPNCHGSQEENSEQFTESTSFPAVMAAPAIEDSLNSVDPLLKDSDDMQRLPSMSSSSCLVHNLNQSISLHWQPGDFCNQINLDGHDRNVPMKRGEVVLPLTSKNLISSGFSNSEARSIFDLDATAEHSRVFSEAGLGNYLGKLGGNVGPLSKNIAADVGESSIISKILSLDSDAWEDTLTSPHSLVKLLNENDNQTSLKIPSLFKESDCRQSRFSFARQEEFSYQASDLEHSCGNIRHSSHQFSSLNGWMKNKDIFSSQLQNISSSSSSVDSDNFFCNHSHSLVSFSDSKGPTSAPPGFAEPNRAPPPGFSTHGIMHKHFDSSVSHLLQTSAPDARNSGRYGDAPYVDPAILEVGNGLQAAGLNNLGYDMRQTSSPQFNPFDYEARLQLLMLQSSSGYQNLRLQHHLMNRFSSPNGTYGISPMLLDQPLPDNLSSFMQSSPAQEFENTRMSTSHLGSLNGVNSINDMGVSDLKTNGGLGFSKFIPTYEDFKCQMSNSSS